MIAIMKACDHCERPHYQQPDRTDPEHYLCPDCADMSVWAVACSYCERIPTAGTPCNSGLYRVTGCRRCDENPDPCPEHAE